MNQEKPIYTQTNGTYKHQIKMEEAEKWWDEGRNPITGFVRRERSRTKRKNKEVKSWSYHYEDQKKGELL